MSKSVSPAPGSIFDVLIDSRRHYRALEPISHGEMVNGVVQETKWKPGDTFDLDINSAKQLLEVNAIELVR